MWNCLQCGAENKDDRIKCWKCSTLKGTHQEFETAIQQQDGTAIQQQDTISSNRNEFLKESIPTYCEKCDDEGYIFIDEPFDTYYVICKVCGSEISAVFCPNCSIGGDYVKNISKRPSSWVCPDCKKVYPISPLIYQNPVYLYFRDMLPKEAIDYINSRQVQYLNTCSSWFFFILLLFIILGPFAAPIFFISTISAMVGIDEVYIALLYVFVWTPLWFGFILFIMGDLIRKIADKCYTTDR